MEKKKYYHYKLEEINGEQEYSYDYLIEAENHAEANEIAERHASSFYDDEPEIVDGSYVFFGGAITTEAVSVEETTKENFTERMLREATLTALS